MSSLDEFADQILLSPTQLKAALAEHERQAAVLAMAVRHVEVVGLWAASGAVSMPAWLREHVRMSHSDAARLVRRGRFFDKFAAVADAAVTRELSAGQVAALQGVCKPKHEPILAEQQDELVKILAPLTVADTEKACGLWKQRADAIVDADEPAEETVRSLTMGRAGDGALVGRFTLDDAAATELEKAIRNASTFDGKDDSRSNAERSGDALFDIAAFFNKNHDSDGTPRHLPNVSISADLSSLDGRPEGVNDDDQRLMNHACVDTYLCDCIIHAILRDADQAPAGFGRSIYTVPRKLFRQVAARDGGCRFPGCDRNVRHCDAHHIKWWRRRGTTNYDNLVLLCSRHHHLVHQLDLDLKLLPNAELHVTWRDGRERTSQPRGAPPKRAST